ncbi:MAG: hypothetical protein H7Z42_05345, partial [Roseiflexaceae bacterium]|nr:hypothetical protein [Roseiflexaceae bacterium]
VPFGSIPAERIAEGTLALLVGGTPQAAGFAGASMPLLFKWGLLALTAWGIITLPSALRRRNRLLAERGVRLGDAAAVAGNGAVGLFLLFVLPDVVGTPLWAMLRFSPDVALLLIAGALSSLLTGALILLLMLRAKAGQGTPATLPAEAA